MKKYLSIARDPVSSLSHFLGAILFFFVTIILMVKCIFFADFSIVSTISSLIFGSSLIALYSASAWYHFADEEKHNLIKLRKLDHAMIYVLIAGTYTPVFLYIYPYFTGIILTMVIWFIAILGIVLKLFWLNGPRWLYTTFYLLMGWFILVDLSPLASFSFGAMAYLIGGGIFYTLGGIIYMIKKPNFSKIFGFHEFFHMFILLGSIMHFLLIFFYIP